MLKALAKNPENRYQTAAEMRTDLVRVHNGEPPEAPKILTDADRSSLMAAPHSSGSAGTHTDAFPASNSSSPVTAAPARSAAGSSPSRRWRC